MYDEARFFLFLSLVIESINENSMGFFSAYVSVYADI